jgi:hypothetical protein
MKEEIKLKYSNLLTIRKLNLQITDFFVVCVQAKIKNKHEHDWNSKAGSRHAMNIVNIKERKE